jgi:hypothetical protein
MLPQDARSVDPFSAAITYAPLAPCTVLYTRTKELTQPRSVRLHIVWRPTPQRYRHASAARSGRRRDAPAGSVSLLKDHRTPPERINHAGRLARSSEPGPTTGVRRLGAIVLELPVAIARELLRDVAPVLAAGSAAEVADGLLDEGWIPVIDPARSGPAVHPRLPTHLDARGGADVRHRKRGRLMPNAPTMLPTTITEGTAPGLSYRLEGELVPVRYMAPASDCFRCPPRF